MKRIEPDVIFDKYPCSIVAVGCAAGGVVMPADMDAYREDGYLTLKSMNRFIRYNLPVKRQVSYKRGERPKLKDLHHPGKAIVCVLGHYLYLENEVYMSFYDNDEDPVVSVWELGD